MVSSFLDGRSKEYNAVDLVNAMYRSRHSTTRAREGEGFLARKKLQQWAVEVVEDMVSREAEDLASKNGGLRLAEGMTWDFAAHFSLVPLARVAWKTSPTCVRILSAVAIAKEGIKNPPTWMRQAQDSTQPPNATVNLAAATASLHVASPSHTEPNTHSSAGPSTPSGQGNNRRDPWVIVIIAFMMLLNARNLRFTMFQKVMGVWLFANSAARSVYDVLGRIGLSVAYSSTLDLLKGLSLTAQSSLRKLAVEDILSVVYDNINQKRQVYDPDYGSVLL
ncbi:hypothetical protein BC835DRAFT_1420038 [Cytidiella melzeri]|nr:hypothetical protein BC835DRAFT_1420038 [Cytidiella melzeri]